MTITADEVRRLIVAQDAARPRSQQRAVGPSDLSSPCDRKIAFQILGVEPVAQFEVNGYAWVGTGIHFQMEAACAHDNTVRLSLVTPGYPAKHIVDLPAARWRTEVSVAVPVTDTVILRGHADAYDRHTKTVIDWKSRGASVPDAKTRDKHHTQLLAYALGLIVAGYEVEHCAAVYIPRNGTLDQIEVDTRPFDHAAADALLARYANLITAAGIGTSVLPLLGTGDDCRFCPWWNPNAWVDGLGCSGHDTKTTGATPAETQPTTTTQKEVVSR